jgi:hypothetical protein
MGGGRIKIRPARQPSSDSGVVGLGVVPGGAYYCRIVVHFRSRCLGEPATVPTACARQSSSGCSVSRKETDDQFIYLRMSVTDPSDLRCVYLQVREMELGCLTRFSRLMLWRTRWRNESHSKSRRVWREGMDKYSEQLSLASSERIDGRT